MNALLPLPAGTCDCHMHIFDRRFAVLPDAMYREATVSDYRALATGLGVDRLVIVQPSGYGFDNACTLDALAQFGGAARAVVVIPPDTAGAQLLRLHALGVRGVRFMLLRPGGLTWEQLAPMADAVAPLGWNLNLQFNGHEMPQRLASLRSLPAQVVIDHVGSFVDGVTPQHEAFRALLTLLETGRAWVKLSGPYNYGMSPTGHPAYPEVAALVRLLAREFPDRCLWATDWPHVSQAEPSRDDELARVFHESVGRDSVWHRILVDNPARLYGFDSHDSNLTQRGPRS